MSVKTTKYIRKALYVDAVRVTKENFDELAQWCDGTVGTDPDYGEKSYIHVRVVNPKNTRQTRAFVGDWILYTERGYKVYTNKAFHSAFNEVIEETPVENKVEETEYPYVDGDATVLGPQTFASADGSVISWKGVNYVPQENGATSVHPDQEQLLSAPSGEGEMIVQTTTQPTIEEKD